MQIPITVSARPTDAPRTGGAAELDPGRLLLGRIAKIDPDGTARINFPGLEARARAGKLLHAGRRILAHVQKARGEILLTLLPGADDGDIVAGTVARREGADILARLTRLGDAELIVRPEANGDSPRPGAPLSAQIQVRGDKVLLQMLPAQIAGGGGSVENVSEATVMAARGDGTVTIDVDGTQLIAESTEPARTGELVRVRLLLIRDKLILQIVPKGSETGIGPATRVAGAEARALFEPRVTDLLENLTSGELKPASESLELFALLLQHAPSITGGGAEQGTWLTGLMRALELILLSPHKAELAEQLAASMENSGIFLESRLLRAATSGGSDAEISGDLKLALLLAAQKSADASRQAAPKGAGAQSPAQAGEIAGKVGRLLNAVTAEQFQNLRLLPTNEIYVQLPFESESGLKSVEIHISPQGKQKTKKIDPQNVVLTLAVSTSNLGRVKAALQIAEGKISCRLKAERDAVVRLLDANTAALKEGLEKLNYTVTYIECALGKTEEDLSILAGLSTTPFDALGSGSDAGLDVRA